MSYSYQTIISESDHGSYQERFMEYAHNWQDNSIKERKRVKIISAPSKDDDILFDEKINSYIAENATKMKIVDIKYSRSSVMLIYEPNEKDS